MNVWSYMKLFLVKFGFAWLFYFLRFVILIFLFIIGKLFLDDFIFKYIFFISVFGRITLDFYYSNGWVENENLLSLFVCFGLKNLSSETLESNVSSAWVLLYSFQIIEILLLIFLSCFTILEIFLWLLLSDRYANNITIPPRFSWNTYSLITWIPINSIKIFSQSSTSYTSESFGNFVKSL